MTMASDPRGPVTTEDSEERDLERALALAFAPLHKRAFGTALGAAAALVLFAVTVLGILLDPEGRTNLALLAQYLAGYEESWMGALIGAAWGFFIGYVAGWFIAFTRNLVLAVWLLIVEAKVDMTETRDFLDHV
jgi:hypothetical protein